MATGIRKTKTKTFAKFDGDQPRPDSRMRATPSGDRLDGNRHMEGIGVNKRGVIARDRDMALPEYQVAAP
jgi:hypothetical protein